VIIKGFKKVLHIPCNGWKGRLYLVRGMRNKAGNVGSEHERVSSELKK
jgi:hypothetical protein